MTENQINPAVSLIHIPEENGQSQAQALITGFQPFILIRPMSEEEVGDRMVLEATVSLLPTRKVAAELLRYVADMLEHGQEVAQDESESESETSD